MTMCRQYTITGMSSIDNGLYGEAAAGISTFLDEMEASLKGFGRETYEGVFRERMAQYEPVFDRIEQLYRQTDDDDKKGLLAGLAEAVADSAAALSAGEKRRSKREKKQLNCNTFAAIYLLPAIIEYGGEMSRPFAEAVRDHWNERFESRVECGEFEKINGSFRTSILGLPLKK